MEVERRHSVTVYHDSPPPQSQTRVYSSMYSSSPGMAPGLITSPQGLIGGSPGLITSSPGLISSSPGLIRSTGPVTTATSSRLISNHSVRQGSVYNLPLSTSRFRTSPLAGLPTDRDIYCRPLVTTRRPSVRVYHSSFSHANNTAASALRIGESPPGLDNDFDMAPRGGRKYRVMKRRPGTCAPCNAFFCGACDYPHGCCSGCNTDGRCDRGGRYLKPAY